MTAKLIIIRGNSASGKTTLAAKLAAKMPQAQTLLLHQDMLRRDLLHASNREGTLEVPLIETLAEFGRQHYRCTIVEGILRRDVYGAMLRHVAATFAPSVWTYYLALPFEETVARDRTKPVPPLAKLLCAAGGGSRTNWKATGSSQEARPRPLPTKSLTR